MAGGLRRGRDQGDPGILDADSVGGTAAPNAPVVALLGGADPGRRPRDEVERSLEGRRLPAVALRAARCARRLGDARARRCAHPSRVRRDPRARARAPAAGRGLPRDPRRRAAGSSRPVAGTRATDEDRLLAHGRRWLDEMLSHGRRPSRRSPATGLDLQTELGLVEVAFQLGKEGPVEVVPTYLGAHAVPPEFRDRPDATEAYVKSVIEEQIPGSPRRAGPAIAMCSARRACSRPTRAAGSSRRPPPTA
jgi:hypothetical protein